MNDGCAPAGRHGRAHRHRPYPSPSYFSTQPHTNKITIYAQSTQTKPTVHTQSTQTTSTVPYVIHPNETNRPTRNPPKRNQPSHAQFSQAKCVGAAPACPPERSRSGVSIPKIHALCTGNERWMRPCRATRAGTQAPPLPISIKPRGVPLPHHIAHSIAPNHAVCSYPTVLHIR